MIARIKQIRINIDKPADCALIRASLFSFRFDELETKKKKTKFVYIHSPQSTHRNRIALPVDRTVPHFSIEMSNLPLNAPKSSGFEVFRFLFSFHFIFNNKNERNENRFKLWFRFVHSFAFVAACAYRNLVWRKSTWNPIKHLVDSLSVRWITRWIHIWRRTGVGVGFGHCASDKHKWISLSTTFSWRSRLWALAILRVRARRRPKWHIHSLPFAICAFCRFSFEHATTISMEIMSCKCTPPPTTTMANGTQSAQMPCRRPAVYR